MRAGAVSRPAGGCAGGADARRAGGVWWRGLAGAALLLALAGCARYRPAPIDPAATAAALTARRLDQPGLVRFLRAMSVAPDRGFGLRALTLVAVYERPGLKLATAEAGAAAAGAVLARQVPNPTLSLSPTFNATQANPSPIRIGPEISFLLANFGARQAGIAAADARVAAARDMVAQAAWQERGAVRAALLALFIDRRALRLSRRLAGTAAEIETTIAGRAASGMLAASVLAGATQAADRARLAVAEARRRRDDDRARLAAAIGMPVAALRHAPLSFAAFAHPIPPRDLPALVRRALVARPDIEAALARYRAADAALRQAVDSQFPGLRIGPGYEYDQGDNKFVLSLSLPLPVLNQHQGQIAVARARRRVAAAAFERVQARALARIDVAAAAWRGSRAVLRAARRLEVVAGRQDAQAAAAYRLGTTGRLRLLEARRGALLARSRRLAAEAEMLRALSGLADALEIPVFRETPA
ncbi:TolC family protein [Acidiphilium sp.]|uniref:TolC family protein n=1 Tax=Acidiphilium sp. TaxID=527 RepID=UPI002684951A|nr:TolC family protein [Acidiphilium sp.]HQT61028.1 TolC family protein [Acidiphilium sp.]